LPVIPVGIKCLATAGLSMWLHIYSKVC